MHSWEMINDFWKTNHQERKDRYLECLKLLHVLRGSSKSVCNANVQWCTKKTLFHFVLLQFITLASSYYDKID